MIRRVRETPENGTSPEESTSATAPTQKPTQESGDSGAARTLRRIISEIVFWW